MVGTRSTRCSSGCEQAITDPVLHVVGTVTPMTPERSREPEAKEPMANELNTGAHVTHPRTSVTDWVSEWWVTIFACCSWLYVIGAHAYWSAFGLDGGQWMLSRIMFRTTVTLLPLGFPGLLCLAAISLASIWISLWKGPVRRLSPAVGVGWLAAVIVCATTFRGVGARDVAALPCLSVVTTHDTLRGECVRMTVIIDRVHVFENDGIFVHVPSNQIRSLAPRKDRPPR